MADSRVQKESDEIVSVRTGIPPVHIPWSVRSHSWKATSDPVMWLLDGDRFGQVARLVDVAAAADGDVIREQLERNNFEQRS